MMTDAENTFSDEQAITVDAVSENVIDLGPPDAGKSAIPLSITVDEAFAALTSLEISIQTDDNAAFSSAATLTKRSWLLADLTLGAKLDMGTLPADMERYARLYYDVTGSDATAGKISAFLVRDKESNNPSY